MTLRLLSLVLAAFVLQRPAPPADPVNVPTKHDPAPAPLHMWALKGTGFSPYVGGQMASGAGSLGLQPMVSTEGPDASVIRGPDQSLPTGSAGSVSFSFDWPEAEVPHWFIEIGKEGDTLHGRYDKLEAGAIPSAETKRPITVSQATMIRLRAAYKTVVSGNCETRAKHIAQTGVKHIAYTMAGSDVGPSCTFNYSDDKELMDAAAAFQAIAETMQMGEKLEHIHRFDRLGLDAQIGFFSDEVAAGHAIELQNIAPVLNSIVNDERVIDRARRKAARLLQYASPPSAPLSEASPR